MSESRNTSPTRVAIYTRSATERSKPGNLVRQEHRCSQAIAEQSPGWVAAKG